MIAKFVKNSRNIFSPWVADIAVLARREQEPSRPPNLESTLSLDSKIDTPLFALSSKHSIFVKYSEERGEKSLVTLRVGT